MIFAFLPFSLILYANPDNEPLGDTKPRESEIQYDVGVLQHVGLQENRDLIMYVTDKKYPIPFNYFCENTISKCIHSLILLRTILILTIFVILV